jgi:hypothetical protein
MTTIVLKDGILASDTRATARGKIISDSFPKIFDVEGEGMSLNGHKVRAYGLAGYVFSRLTLDSILREGLQVGSTLDTDDEFTSIVITEGPSYAVSKDADAPSLRIIEIPDNVPWAIGSGSSVASYVMFSGGDAVKAVIEACKVDTGSGGDVFVWQK